MTSFGSMNFILHFLSVITPSQVDSHATRFVSECRMIQILLGYKHKPSSYTGFRSPKSFSSKEFHPFYHNFLAVHTFSNNSLVYSPSIVGARRSRPVRTLILSSMLQIRQPSSTSEEKENSDSLVGDLLVEAEASSISASGFWSGGSTMCWIYLSQGPGLDK